MKLFWLASGLFAILFSIANATPEDLLSFDATDLKPLSDTTSIAPASSDLATSQQTTETENLLNNDNYVKIKNKIKKLKKTRNLNYNKVEENHHEGREYEHENRDEHDAYRPYHYKIDKQETKPVEPESIAHFDKYRENSYEQEEHKAYEHMEHHPEQMEDPEHNIELSSKELPEMDELMRYIKERRSSRTYENRPYAPSSSEKRYPYGSNEYKPAESRYLTRPPYYVTTTTKEAPTTHTTTYTTAHPTYPTTTQRYARPYEPEYTSRYKPVYPGHYRQEYTTTTTVETPRYKPSYSIPPRYEYTTTTHAPTTEATTHKVEYTNRYKPNYPVYKPEYTTPKQPEHPTTYKPEYPATHRPEYPTTHKPDYPATHRPEYPTTHKPEYPTTHKPEYTTHRVEVTHKYHKEDEYEEHDAKHDKTLGGLVKVAVDSIYAANQDLKRAFDSLKLILQEYA